MRPATTFSFCSESNPIKIKSNQTSELRDRKVNPISQTIAHPHELLIATIAHHTPSKRTPAATSTFEFVSFWLSLFLFHPINQHNLKSVWFCSFHFFSFHLKSESQLTDPIPMIVAFETHTMTRDRLERLAAGANVAILSSQRQSLTN